MAEVDEDAEAEQIAEKLCSHTEDKGEMLQALVHIQSTRVLCPRCQSWPVAVGRWWRA